MPELPEVETTVRGLARFLEGERITGVRINRPDMRFPFPEGLVQHLTGARITHLSRRAKYGLLHSDRDHALVFHLGMSGRWRIDYDADEKHDHLVLETGDHRFALNDPRRFGWVDWVGEDSLDAWPGFAKLGPEPLGDALDHHHLKSALKSKVTPIKLALLDQRVVAGLGNIYVCEALHRAHIHPRKPAGKVSGPALARLVLTIREVLEQSIRDGGSSLRDFAHPDGELGYFATNFRVYGREGAACLGCKTGTVRQIVQGGRSTWFCPHCQK